MKTTEIAKVKKVLGSHYSPKIIKHLTKLKIFNAVGEQFSAGSIRKIVSGEQPNADIELKILQLVAREAKKQAAAQRKRDEITKNIL